MPEKPFRLVVKAVILDDAGRSLLIRRSPRNRNFVGKWDWPGGKCEPGEPFDNALTREVLEETGLGVEVAGLVGATSFEMPDAHVILLCMEARVIGGDLKLGEEHDRVAWVLPGEYPGYELHDNARFFMLEYAAKKGSGA
jgi:8-oxo-dGTP diphosphatase